MTSFTIPKISRVTLKPILSVLCILLVFVVVPSIAQVAPVQVYYPVDGEIAFTLGGNFGDDRRLVSLNTFAGTLTTLVENSGRFDNAVWDRSGQHIAFDNNPNDFSLIDVENLELTQIEQFPGYNEDVTVGPFGWTLDQQSLLYLGGSLENSHSINNLYFYNFAENLLSSSLQRFDTSQGVSITNFPLPGGYYGFISDGAPPIVRLNPVYDEWMLVQLQGSAYTSPDLDESSLVGFVLSVLWNYNSGQIILVNDYVQERVLAGYVDWSHDGRYLLLNTAGTYRDDYGTYILHFADNGRIEFIDSAITDERLTAFWLDAGNIFIAYSVSSETHLPTYYLAEIVDGVWHEREFLQLNDPAFQHMGNGDWYLRADETERQQLSCLFDQALPSRLQVAQQGQVAITDGTPSRLRSEPGLIGEETDLMVEGISFTILNGPSCANGYRWWEIQLADGTTGWAAEADVTAYFLEPITAVTPSPTPIPLANGLVAELFDNPALDGAALFTRLDPQVDFDWGLGSPDPRLESDNFSIRWSGEVLPTFSETYTFSTYSDDGVRLWVDGQLLIDQFVEQAATDWSGTIDLEAGQRVPIVLEYFEAAGEALVSLRWESASQEWQVIPSANLFSAMPSPPTPPFRGRFLIEWHIQGRVQVATPASARDGKGGVHG
jgi:hypothetical protein